MNGSILFPLLLAIPGALLVRRLRPGAPAAELAGLGGLVGLGTGLAFVWAAGAAGLPLSAPVVFTALGAAAAALGAVAAGLGAAARRAGPRTGAAGGGTKAASPAWTPAEIAVLVVVLAVFLSSAWRASFYPVSAMDAHAYDGRARWIAAERTLDISVYDIYRITGDGNLTYPPLMPLGLALARWTGADQGKPIDAFYFGALLCTVYGVLRRRLPRLGALAAAALTAMIPELWLHASLGLTNLPATAFLTASFLTAADALGRLFETGRSEAGRRRDWILPGLLAAFAAGVRPDAIVPAAGAAGVAALILVARTRRVLPALETGTLLLGPAVFLTLAWRVQLKGMIAPGGDPVFRSSPVPDPVLAGNTFRALVELLPNPALTGWAVPVFLLGAAAALAARGARGAGAPRAGETTGDRDPRSGTSAPAVYGIHCAFTLVTLLLLFALFQQIDPRFGGGGGSYLQNSLKRALFYILPVAIVTGFLSPPIRAGWERVDRFQRAAGKDS